ncbi:endonuclease V [Chitinophaga skermanii]|uniref:Endonuclease V n=1 Tax=Chitinophaga skermanii TaxID=331697 RepID=A0A327R349_9BACT|nr:deoxyribonuclease V [Chitinophaga skermanii]RAJ11140.1 endonuclease V [Chitinophaga skermanii]
MHDEQSAIALQDKLRTQVITHDQFATPLQLIAGCDVEYDKDTNLIAGSIVVLDAETLSIVEVATHVMEVTFPYIPGLFSFRELPPLLEAFKKLQQHPQLIVCDGQGLAHPRKFGMASHLGISLDIPTIGCGKTRLCGIHGELPPEKGAFVGLYDETDNTLIGNVLRTQPNINPVYVSIGHKVSLETATNLVLHLCTQYRLPETTRIADHYGRLAMLEAKGEKDV